MFGRSKHAAPVAPEQTPVSPAIPGTPQHYFSQPADTAAPALSAAPQPETGPLPIPTSKQTAVQTGHLPALAEKRVTTQTVPIVIPGSRTRKLDTWRPPRPQGKRIWLHATVSVLLVFILAGALFAVLPTGADGHSSVFGSFNPFMNMTDSKNNNTGLVAAQAATATAVTQDGYDAGSTAQYTYVYQATLPGAGYDHFAAGQCTYWASYRYHQLTGYWVPWYGNAWEWYGAAYNSPDWIASSTPHVPSIVVLAPGVQGASWTYGHVAVLEAINADGSLLTSNWNWAGNWGRTTYVTFYPGSGVHFVWHP